MQCRAQVSPLISLCNLCQLLAPVTHSLSRREWLKWSGWKRDLKKTVCVWLSMSTSTERDTFIIYPLSEKGCPWKVLLTVFSVLLLQHELSDFIFSFYWHHCDYENKKTTANVKLTVFSQLPVLTHSFSIQDHPLHLPTRWRTAPRERKLCRRQSEEGEPLQV